MEYVVHIDGSSAIAEVTDLVVDGEVFTVNWAEYCGTKYKPNMFVIYRHNFDDGLQEFGRICKILPRRGDCPYFLLQTYETKGFDDHFHAYVIDGSCTGWKAVPADGLLDHHPVSVWAPSISKQSEAELLVAMCYLVL